MLEELDLTIPKPYLFVYQCVPVELKTMDIIVELLSQVGAYRLIPVLSKRGFNKREVIRARGERWKRIAVESLKQCGRPKPLEIGELVSIEDLPPMHRINLLLDNFGEGKLMKELDFTTVEDVGLVVGPEGGFTQEEAKLLRKRGFISVRLKPYTLKSETAGAMAVGLIMNLA